MKMMMYIRMEKKRDIVIKMADKEYKCGGDCLHPNGSQCRHSRKLQSNKILQCALRPTDILNIRRIIHDISCKFEAKIKYVKNNYQQILQEDHHVQNI